MGKPTVDQIKKELSELNDRELLIEQTTWLRLNQRRLIAIDNLISTWSWIYAIAITIGIIALLISLEQ